MTLRLRQRQLGGSVVCNTTGGDASATDASFAPGAGSWTIRAWRRLSPNTSTFNILFYFIPPASNGWEIAEQGSTIFIYVNNGGPTFTATLPRDSGWHLWTYVFDASVKRVTIYRDGVQLAQSGTSVWAGSVSSTTFRLAGNGSSGVGQTYSDIIYDVGTAWTAADVAADYYDGMPPATYTHRWPCDDSSGASPVMRATRGGVALTGSAGLSCLADSPMTLRNAAINRQPYSEDMTGTGSAYSALGVSSRAAYGGPFPAGVTGATLVTDNGATTVHTLYPYPNNPLQLGGKIIIASCYAKKVAGSGWFMMACSQGSVRAWFDLTNMINGTSSTDGPAPVYGQIFDYDMVDVGGGWARCWIRYIQPLSTWAEPLNSQGLRWATTTANGVASYTGSGAQQIAIGGNMQEIAVPGQTTPSPYVSTAAAPLSAYGFREYRQNLIRWSEDQTNAVWLTSDGAVVAGGFADPVGGTAASKLTFGPTTNTYDLYQTLQVTRTNLGVGQSYTFSAWVKADVAGTVGLGDVFASFGAQFNVTTSWTRISFTVSATSPTIFGPGIFKKAASPTYVYVYGVQVEQSNRAGEYVKTTSAVANSSGPPRNNGLTSLRGTVTNLALQSGAMSASPWSQSILTGAGGQADPLGGTGATLWTEVGAAGSTTHYTIQSPGLVTGTRYVFSFYAKAGVRTACRLSNGSNNQGAYFNLSTGAVVSADGGASANIESVAGFAGWYRCSMAFTAVGTSGVRVFTAVGANEVYDAGAGTAAITTFGAQVEVAAQGQTTPSPYASSGAASGVGLRETRQNLCLWSEDLTKATYGVVRSSTVADGATIPPGFPAGSFQWKEDGSASTTHEIRLNGTGFTQPSPVGLPVTVSCLVKAGVRTWIALFGNAGGTSSYFDLGNGVKGSLNGARALSASMLPLGGGWYLCSHTFTFDGTYAAFAMATADAGIVFSGVNLQVALYLQRIQLVQANSLTEYIAATSAPANPGGAPRILNQ